MQLGRVSRFSLLASRRINLRVRSGRERVNLEIPLRPVQPNHQHLTLPQRNTTQHNAPHRTANTTHHGLRLKQSPARPFVILPPPLPLRSKSLTPSSNTSYTPLTRQPSSYKPLQTYALDKEKQYQQQYGDMYFLRLAKLKPAVEAVGADAWEGFVMGGEEVERTERVLDVRQGKLCWVAGTIYMEMPLKPNILDDISKDVSPSSPPRGNWSMRRQADEALRSIGSPRRRRGRSTSRRRERIS